MAEATVTTFTEPEFDTDFDPTQGRPDLAAFAWREMEQATPEVKRMRELHADVQDEDLVEELSANHAVDLEDVPYGVNLMPMVVSDKVSAQTIQEMNCLDGTPADQLRTRQIWAKHKMAKKYRRLFRGKSIDGDGSMRIWKGAKRSTADYYDATSLRSFFAQNGSGEVAFSVLRWQVGETWHEWLDFPGDYDTQLGRTEKFICEGGDPRDPDSWAKDYSDGYETSVIETVNGLDEVVARVEQFDLDENGQRIPVWPLPSWTTRHVVVPFPNGDIPNSDYGRSDIFPLIRPHNEINFVNRQKIVSHRLALFPAYMLLTKMQSGQQPTQDDLGLFAEWANDNVQTEPQRDAAGNPISGTGGKKAPEIQHLTPGLLLRRVADSLQKAQTEEPAGYIASFDDAVKKFALAGFQLVANLVGGAAPSGEAIIQARSYNIAWKRSACDDDSAPVGEAFSLLYEAETGQVRDFLPVWKQDISVGLPTLTEMVKDLGYTQDYAQQALGTTSEERERMAEEKAAERAQAIKDARASLQPTEPDTGTTANTGEKPSPFADTNSSEDSTSSEQ